MGAGADRAHIPKIVVSVRNRAIDDSPVRRPCNTDIAVAVLVSRAQRTGFGLLAWRGYLDGGKNLVLQRQQCFSIRAGPDCRVGGKFIIDLPACASPSDPFSKPTPTALRPPSPN